MKNPRLEFYRDGLKEYRWRLRAANNKIVADSGEGYLRMNACVESARRVADMMDDSIAAYDREQEARLITDEKKRL